MHPSDSERSKLLSLKYLREMLLLFTMIQKGTISAISWDIVDGKTGFSWWVVRGRYHTDQNSRAWSKVLLVHNAIEHHCKEYFQSMMTLCQSTYRSYFSRLLSKRDMQDFILKKYATSIHVGESLFTLFASLTYAYHYLMMMIPFNKTI